MKIVHFFDQHFNLIPNLSMKVTNVDLEIIHHKNRLPALEKFFGAKYVRIFEGFGYNKPLTPFYDKIDFVQK